MPKVSIVMPVYGVEQYIDKCLYTCVNQTLKDIEIIVVNDGTKDNSQEIIDKYAAKDSRIIAIKKENGGQASARNLGISLATGDFIGFVDSDDSIELDMYEKLYNEAIKTDSDIVVANYYIVKDDVKTEDNAIFLETDDVNKNYIFSQPAPWNKLYKRNLWIDNSMEFAQGMIYEDYAVIPAFALYTNRIAFINDCVYNYLVREGSTMNQFKFNPKFKDIIPASQTLLDNISFTDRYREEFEYVIFRNTIRDNYFKLRKIPEAMSILSDMIDWFKVNFPNWKKNPYIRNEGFRYMLYSKLIINKQFWFLNLLKKR